MRLFDWTLSSPRWWHYLDKVEERIKRDIPLWLGGHVTLDYAVDGHSGFAEVFRQLVGGGEYIHVLRYRLVSRIDLRHGAITLFEFSHKEL